MPPRPPATGTSSSPSTIRRSPPACAQEHPADPGRLDPGLHVSEGPGRDAQHHPGGPFPEEGGVIRHPGHLEADPAAHRHLGQSHPEAALGDVMDAVDQNLPAAI